LHGALDRMLCRVHAGQADSDVIPGRARSRYRCYRHIQS
jgi:hypothetical protein